MKDFLTTALEILKMGKAIAKAYREAKDKAEKAAIRKAIKKRDLDKLRKLVFK